MENAVEELGMGAAAMAAAVALSLMVCLCGHYGGMLDAVSGNLQRDAVVAETRHE